ncbi:uncharacterized protein LOC129780529 [Toxorhynchites rutilus septentrionalis]|uniref:uncharacterized protein LOC129780529 n=1 Tax=Toxorhynchites rutilus septentrionalis TaxID=329112 RepID=UPI002478CA94|nr:uncharacterized protein LOC129780529 [Toxorhynchites rutilus septentrionalis]
MVRSIWGKCCNDEVEIIYYDEQYRERSLNVLRKSFFVHEAVCIGSEVNIDPQAQKDLEQLCLDVARSGTSLIARHVPSNEIVGVSFNVLQTPSAPDDANYFESFRDNHCISECSKNLMQYMITMDSKVDLFKKFNINCLLEIMFLATVPDFEGKGVGTKLVECSVELARSLKNGEANESKHKRPELVSSLFTSRISQKVGTKNGFKQVNEVPHGEFVFRGKSYSERIGPDHPTSVLVIKEI